MLEGAEALAELRGSASGVHDIGDPCPSDVLLGAEGRLGAMPTSVRRMLSYFNGGEFFIDAIPLLTVFGLSSTALPLPPAIDLVERTLMWRRTRGAARDWVIGMINYGGHFVLDSETETIREWDSPQGRWSEGLWTFNEWVRRMLEEGEAYLKT